MILPLSKGILPTCPPGCLFLYHVLSCTKTGIYEATLNCIMKLIWLKASSIFPAGLVSSWISPLSHFAVESHEHLCSTKVGAALGQEQVARREKE